LEKIGVHRWQKKYNFAAGNRRQIATAGACKICSEKFIDIIRYRVDYVGMRGIPGSQKLKGVSVESDHQNIEYQRKSDIGQQFLVIFEIKLSNYSKLATAKNNFAPSVFPSQTV
jgi:hypothetical protein